MKYIILIDFGSTFTKATVVCREEKKAILSLKYPSTVKSDARIALNQCFNDIEKELGLKGLENIEKYASSSAAGGLRIAVIGLTPSLSISAARNAAFSAGGKIVASAMGKISEDDLESIYKSKPDIILFCGGYENGNKSIVMHNAKILANSDITCPIIYGGNSVLSKSIRKLMIENNKICFLVPNIIPNIGEINTAACELIIRDLFMDRIIDMKGLHAIRSVFKGVITPTPAAVLAAGNLLSCGTENEAGLGELIIVDVGGATTDIHSYAEQTIAEGSKIIGASEPYAKRTVEGDLGMRESSNTLVVEMGIESMALDLGLTVQDLKQSINIRVSKPDYLPDSQTEAEIDQKLASGALRIASIRHAGYLDPIHNNCYKYIQYGKNLRNVKTILGTGGQIVNSKEPVSILKNILNDDAKILLPTESSFYLDKDYILYAAGLLSKIDKDLAIDVLKNGIIPI